MFTCITWDAWSRSQQCKQHVQCLRLVVFRTRRHSFSQSLDDEEVNAQWPGTVCFKHPSQLVQYWRHSMRVCITGYCVTTCSIISNSDSHIIAISSEDYKPLQFGYGKEWKRSAGLIKLLIRKFSGVNEDRQILNSLLHSNRQLRTDRDGDTQKGYQSRRLLTMMMINSATSVTLTLHILYRVRLCSRMVTVLAWTAEGPGFKSWFGRLSRVGLL